MKIPGCHRSPVIRIPFTISSPIPQQLNLNQPIPQQPFLKQPIIQQQLVIQQPTNQPLVQQQLAPQPFVTNQPLVQQPFAIQQPFLPNQPTVQGFPQPIITNQPFAQNQPTNNQQVFYQPVVQPGYSQMVQPSAPAEMVTEKAPNQLSNAKKVPTEQPPSYNYAVNNKM